MTRPKDLAHPVPPSLEARQDALDPELVALEAPPSGRRVLAMTLMAAVIVASGGLLASLRGDVAYFLSDAPVVELGDVTGVAAASLASNQYVRVTGTPMLAHTLRFQKVLSSDTYTVFPLAGQRTIFVQQRSEGPESERQAGRTEFTGRLVTFGELGGRAAELRRFYRERAGIPVSSNTFLLLADEPPGSYGWSIVLALVCAVFIVMNGVLFVRWFRPLPVARASR